MTVDLPLKPNTLYHGDCLDVMQAWVEARPGGCVDLIYLDPPFNSNANYNIIYGKDRKGKPLDERAQFTAFGDTWYWGSEAAERVRDIKNAVAHPAHKAVCGLAEMLPESGMLAYLSYMAERLAVMHTLLKDTGSLYLHCDPTASHYLKTILDCIFGGKQFRNELIWCYKERELSKKQWNKKHDVILFYTKSDRYTFNWKPVAAEYSAYTVDKKFKHTDEEGKRYRLRYKDGRNDPPQESEDTYRQYMDVGVPPRDWIEIPILNQAARERLGYPTQKPLALLERIVKASSNKGDLVLDPFCGCGTTAEAAWKLGRKFIGIDISPFAITRVCKDRLKNARGVSVMGLPTDLPSARLLAKTDPFAFEHWAISCLAGFAPNNRQTGDGGVDGRGRLLNPPVGEDGKAEKGLCVAQVKGGKFTPADLRAFLSQIAGGRASLGVFVTLEKQNITPTMREVLGNAGKLQPQGEAKSYERIVFWSLEEYFAGVEANLPGMTHPFTGKALHPEIPSG